MRCASKGKSTPISLHTNWRSRSRLNISKQRCQHRKSEMRSWNQITIVLWTSWPMSTDSESSLKRCWKPGSETRGELVQDACLVEQRDQEIQQLEMWLAEAKTSLAQQIDEHDKLTTQLNEQRTWTEHLQHDLDSHHRAFETIRRQRDELRDSRDDLANRLRATEEQAEAAAVELDRLVGLEERTQGYQTQLRQQQIELESASRRVRETVLDRDTIQAHLATLQEQLEQHQRQLRVASDKHEVLRDQREEILTALRQEEKRHSETSKALEEQTERLASVSHEIEQLQSLREELSAARQQVTAREQQLRGASDSRGRTRPTEDGPVDASGSAGRGPPRDCRVRSTGPRSSARQ